MNIEQILDEWAKDTDIDRDRLSDESLNISKLHSKYYRIYVKCKMRLIKLQNDKKEMLKTLHEYYEGILDKEELEEMGRKPMNLRILKGDIPKYIDADKEYIELNLKTSLEQEKVSLVESIIKSLHQRGFDIRNAIEFEKFRAGG